MIYKKQYEKLRTATAELRKKSAVVALWNSRIYNTGQTIDGFCRAHKIPPESYSRWVNGGQEPGWDTIHRVEVALIKAESVLHKKAGK
jgi:hypothetical protein